MTVSEFKNRYLVNIRWVGAALITIIVVVVSVVRAHQSVCVCWTATYCGLLVHGEAQT